jgi:hypothetical protein
MWPKRKSRASRAGRRRFDGVEEVGVRTIEDDTGVARVCANMVRMAIVDLGTEPMPHWSAQVRQSGRPSTSALSRLTPRSPREAGALGILGVAGWVAKQGAKHEQEANNLDRRRKG